MSQIIIETQWLERYLAEAYDEGHKAGSGKPAYGKRLVIYKMMIRAAGIHSMDGDAPRYLDTTVVGGK